jgi:hypothetical protein
MEKSIEQEKKKESLKYSFIFPSSKALGRFYPQVCFQLEYSQNKILFRSHKRNPRAYSILKMEIKRRRKSKCKIERKGRCYCETVTRFEAP